MLANYRRFAGKCFFHIKVFFLTYHHGKTYREFNLNLILISLKLWYVFSCLVSLLHFTCACNRNRQNLVMWYQNLGRYSKILSTRCWDYTSSYSLLQKMASRIPPLLDPYLALPPEASLVLLTSVLGASSNWLVLRFLYSALQSQDAVLDPTSGGDTKVLLVSFMRDLAFWKENARRLVGINFPFSVESRDGGLKAKCTVGSWSRQVGSEEEIYFYRWTEWIVFAYAESSAWERGADSSLQSGLDGYFRWGPAGRRIDEVTRWRE